jgi:hypothetical protein
MSGEGVRVVWGWYPDPYGIHQERYVSGDGTPTKLVRDDSIESYDPPPAPPDMTGAEIRIEQGAPGEGHRGPIRLTRCRKPHRGPTMGSI